MTIAGKAAISAGWAALLVLAGSMIVADASRAPWSLMISITVAARPWRHGWKAAEGTTLRGALAWGGLALVLAVLAQAVALAETVPSGRPWTGRITYLVVLAILAALISVLGARSPGSGAWAILMVLLVVVFLIPWLEAAGRLRREAGLGVVQLDSPWSWFYGLLVLAGVTNYLPTRYGPAAVVLGAGLLAQWLALTRSGWSDLTRTRIWAFVAWSIAASAWCAERCAARPLAGGTPLERLWLWFRDHWGVVWALRTQERFNRTADLASWPARMTWFGVAPTSSTREPDPTPLTTEAETTLRNLLRRFVTGPRIDAVLTDARARPCDPESPAR
jgi:hypothetical protein